MKMLRDRVEVYEVGNVDSDDAIERHPQYFASLDDSTSSQLFSSIEGTPKKLPASLSFSGTSIDNQRYLDEVLEYYLCNSWIIVPSASNADHSSNAKMYTALFTSLQENVETHVSITARKYHLAPLCYFTASFTAATHQALHDGEQVKDLSANHVAIDYCNLDQLLNQLMQDYKSKVAAQKNTSNGSAECILL